MAKDCVSRGVFILGDIRPDVIASEISIGSNWSISLALKALLNSASICIANLEGVLGDLSHPISKTGKHSGGDTKVAEYLQKLGIHIVSLANNHAFDFGRLGLRSTMSALKEQGIGFVGAGECEEEAWHFSRIVIDKESIGIIGVSHNEFGVAGFASPGVAGFNEWMAFRSIQSALKTCDKVIILYHGAVEYLRFPSPDLRRRCLFFMEAGADAVICQHSHIAGAFEIVEGKPIIYGQGDFMAKISHNSIADAACSAFLVELQSLSSTRGFQLNLHPIRISKNSFYRTVELIEGTERELALKDIHYLCSLLADEKCWRREWDRVVNELGPFLESQLAQSSSIRQKMGCRLPMLRKRIDRNHRIVLENLIRCEAHREVILDWLSLHSRNEGQ